MTKLKHHVRHDVAARDGWKCAYCGLRVGCATCDVAVPKTNRATLDHVMPRAEGGTNALWNLVLACQACNAEKGHKPWIRPQGWTAREREIKDRRPVKVMKRREIRAALEAGRRA